MSKDLVVIDFETEAVDDAKPQKPKPVGLAVQGLTKYPRYMAWGHKTGNGVYELRGKKLLRADGDAEQIAKVMYREAMRRTVLGHNVAKFDLAVGHQAWGIKSPPWHRVHDTLFSLFLFDPHASSLALKPSADRLLGTPPEERDAVYDWLAEHGVIGKPSVMVRCESRVTAHAGWHKQNKNCANPSGSQLRYPNNAGYYICEAPGDLVAGYAIGDVTRTEALHRLVLPSITKDGMLPAYDRERQLAPILLENESQGMRVDVRRLARDLKTYEATLERVDDWLRRRLKAPGINVDSDEEIAAALRSAGVVEVFPLTATGKDSVSKKRLTRKYFMKPKVWSVLYYRNALAYTLINMRKWGEQGEANEGYLYRQWSQVRQSHHERGFKGARSGRITVSDFQNISKSFTDKGDGFKEALEARELRCLRFDVPELPLLRCYCLPDKGEVWGHSDYDQQEMKLVAHYEAGALCEQYNRDPKTDVHNFVQQLIKNTTGRDLERRIVKILDFRTAYGSGIAGFADALEVSYDKAREIIDLWRAALPDVVRLDKACKELYEDGKAIRTLGGRLYRVKPPVIIKRGPREGDLVTFVYTALNYLIQPSAADQSKQAIIDYHGHPKRRARLVVTVHDELNISIPKKIAKPQLKLLRECMVGAFKLDIPVTTTLKLGRSWGELRKVEP